MSLGFSVADLLPKARGGGALRMGLVRLDEATWLDPAPDLACRAEHLARHPGSVQVLPEAQDACGEAAALVAGVDNLGQAACRTWEDLCVLTRVGEQEPFRLTGAAVAFPTDWVVADKLGLPLGDVHAPIHGYAGRFSEGVDRFVDGLRPGEIWGRANWFVVPSGAWRYLPGDAPAARFAHVSADNAGDTLFVRCERQTLRCLPQTGGVLFTIGVYREPLANVPLAELQRIVSAFDHLIEGEGGRRAAPHYAAALRSHAQARGTVEQARAA